MTRKQKIIEFLEREFPQFGFVVDEVGNSESAVRHRVGEDCLRPGQTVSGPVLFGVADAALYIAVLGEIGIVPHAVTTSMNINFLRKPAADQDIIGRCRLLKLGRRLAVGEVSLYSEGNPEPVAHAVGTYSIPTH